MGRGKLSIRGRLLLAVATGLLLAAAVATWIGRPVIEGWLSRGQSLPARGRIALPTADGLVVYSVQERRGALLVPAARGETVTAAAWSPDSRQIAYGLFHRRPGDPADSVEIYLVGADGSGPMVLAERDRPGVALDIPAWSRDGREVYFTFYGVVGGRPVLRVDRIAVATGQRITIVEDAYAPAISPAGGGLLFLRDERAGPGLWLAPLGGGGVPAPVLRPGRSPSLGVPRVSPDGSRVAVSLPVSFAGQREESSVLGWLGPSVAYAHGEPADIWSFDLQGNDPRRLTRVNGDDPTPAWSPDGRHLAVWGGTGLYLVNVADGQAQLLLDQGGYGIIDWAPD